MNLDPGRKPAERNIPERRGGILPREQGAVSLDLVIGVMAFLAALALGGVLIAHRSAVSWEAGLSGRLTVQILPQGDATPQNEVNAAVGVLRATQGVVSATPATLDTAAFSIGDPS